MDPFVAEIRIFPFNFAPKGWAFCDGQILPLSQNTALFSLLGTSYGGDGKSNFALPNLQGAAPVAQGQGPGLSQYFVGENSGTDYVTLVQPEMPGHTHDLQGDGNAFDGVAFSPSGALPGNAGSNNIYSTNAPAPVAMNVAMVSIAGGGQPHNNMMPYLTLNYCIALQGVFPPRG